MKLLLRLQQVWNGDADEVEEEEEEREEQVGA